jgi:hypothetical protein
MTLFKRYIAIFLSVSALGLGVSGDASAREGNARSIGKGLKCWFVFDPATGINRQVCGKKGV